MLHFFCCVVSQLEEGSRSVVGGSAVDTSVFLSSRVNMLRSIGFDYPLSALQAFLLNNITKYWWVPMKLLWNENNPVFVCVHKLIRQLFFCNFNFFSLSLWLLYHVAVFLFYFSKCLHLRRITNLKAGCYICFTKNISFNIN